MGCLVDPLVVKWLTFKNRIVMPSMNTDLATSKGVVTDHLIAHYVRRSPALGLAIVEHSYVSPEGKLSERQLGIYDDSLVQGLGKLSESIHATGIPVVLQINHAGGKASIDMTGLMPVAPSRRGNARDLQGEEIDVLVEAFARAAERAVKAGFDGVEIHGAHGFLLNQFYSPLTNRRRDRYGGPLENRIRFPLAIVEGVKRKLGRKLLFYRLGSDDLDPRGTRIEDSQEFSVKLEERGVDIIDVSGGLCGGEPAGMKDTQGYFIPQAQRIKEVVNIPVIGVGGIKDPRYADILLREEKVDLIAVGRELLRDPDWGVKAIEPFEKRRSTRAPKKERGLEG
jgi:2,4-dienoyl-CoA reductase-like NADH-dependent reductase (Old Yellow Enzyme family)